MKYAKNYVNLLLIFNVFALIISETINIPKEQENHNNSNFLWYNCTQFYRDDAWVNILHSDKDGDVYCSLWNVAKTMFSS